MNLNNEDKSIIKRNVITLIAPIILVAIFFNLKSFINTINSLKTIIFPFLLGIGFAFILNIPMKGIEKLLVKAGIKNKNIKRAISIILSFLLIFGILIVLIAIAMPQLTDSIKTLFQEIPGFFEEIITTMKKNELLSQYAYDFEEFLENLDFNQMLEYIKNSFSNDSLSIGHAFTSVRNIIGGVTNFFIALVFSIYCLATKEDLLRQAKEVIYTFLNEKIGDKLLHIGRVINQNFYNFFTGQLIEAFILGMMVFVGMIIFKLPFAPLIAPLVGIGNLIPFIGAFMTGTFGVLIILIESPMKALIFLIVLIILQQLEADFIYPKVVGSQVGLPSIWVLVGITIGGSVGGIFGIVMGVPITSTIYILLKEYKDNILKEKKINISEK